MKSLLVRAAPKIKLFAQFSTFKSTRAFKWRLSQQRLYRTLAINFDTLPIFWSIEYLFSSKALNEIYLLRFMQTHFKEKKLREWYLKNLHHQLKCFWVWALPISFVHINSVKPVNYESFFEHNNFHSKGASDFKQFSKITSCVYLDFWIDPISSNVFRIKDKSCKIGSFISFAFYTWKVWAQYLLIQSRTRFLGIGKILLQKTFINKTRLSGTVDTNYFMFTIKEIINSTFFEKLDLK